jgi:phosphoenolpyruvate phosphomutase
LDETLKRAKAYADAEADAILIHSKISTCSEIDSFMNKWMHSKYRYVPIVIVPTKYYGTPTEHFSQIGISTIIWANHNVRASITAMQETSLKIFEEQSLTSIEGKVASVSEIFRLQHDEELREAEKRYTPAGTSNVKAVILAATKGSVSADTPKALMYVNGKQLLERHIKALNNAGVNDITTIIGAGADQYANKKSQYIYNANWENNSEIDSLLMYMNSHEAHDLVVLYGDILYEQHILDAIVSDKTDIITAAIDMDFASLTAKLSKRQGIDAVVTILERDYAGRDANEYAPLERYFYRSEVEGLSQNGEFIGMWKISEKSYNDVREILNQIVESWNYTTCVGAFDLITACMKTAVDDNRLYVKALPVFGSWSDIDTEYDAINTKL